jgi:hypothetical protein
MIHEEICTYELCKLAKEKGFNEYVEAFYAEDCNMPHTQGPEKWNEYKGRCAVPTQGLLQRWLREKKNIHIEIIATASGYYWCVNKTNGTSITDSDVLDRGTNDGGCFDTFELALEDALKYALENLV